MPRDFIARLRLSGMAPHLCGRFGHALARATAPAYQISGRSPLRRPPDGPFPALACRQRIRAALAALSREHESRREPSRARRPTTELRHWFAPGPMRERVESALSLDKSSAACWSPRRKGARPRITLYRHRTAIGPLAFPAVNTPLFCPSPQRLRREGTSLMEEGRRRAGNPRCGGRNQTTTGANV